MPVDINQLCEGWLELESDPGLFTLLLEDFGVKGVQVEEIYDLQKPIENPVYGFIFLFRWTEERRSRRKIVDRSNMFVTDEEVVNSLFFAQQMVPNSCATHALLSVLLNCPKIQLGDTLDRLKSHTTSMGPENKGWAIGNTPELAKAHNSHATPQARHRQDKTSGISTGKFVGEAFHFVSYVPINGHLFELDGLKPYPIDHGPWKENEEWTSKFQQVMRDRLGITTNEVSSDIRYNLMAVVPDKRLAITHKLNMLKTNRQIVLEAFQQLVQQSTSALLTHPHSDSKLSLNTLPSDKKADYSTPLTIQTSPVPSSSSTDTSSEVGSALNSPCQSSPYTKDFSKFVVIRVAMGGDLGEYGSRAKKVCLEAGALPSGWEKPPGARLVASAARISSLVAEKKPEEEHFASKKLESQNHTFAPKDLLALVKNLETEISHCEGLLYEENEKRKQYKIDDSRRTFNYDPFICAFLTLLAQQGKLADLVQQHLCVPRKPLNQVSSSAVAARNAPISKKQLATNKKKCARPIKSRSKK